MSSTRFGWMSLVTFAWSRNSAYKRWQIAVISLGLMLTWMIANYVFLRHWQIWARFLGKLARMAHWCLYLLLQLRRRRFIPVAVFVIALLRTSSRFQGVCSRISALALKVKRFTLMKMKRPTLSSDHFQMKSRGSGFDDMKQPLNAWCESVLKCAARCAHWIHWFLLSHLTLCSICR